MQDNSVLNGTFYSIQNQVVHSASLWTFDDCLCLSLVLSKGTKDPIIKPILYMHVYLAIAATDPYFRGYIYIHTHTHTHSF